MGSDPPAPADVDPAEFPPEDALTISDAAPLSDSDAPELATVSDGVPLAVDAKTPPVERTGNHRMTPAQFATGVELADRDGYVRGFEHGRARGYREGHAAGVLEGRADIRAEDFEAGREAGYDDFRRAMIASRTDPAIALIERDRLRAWARAHPASQ